MKPAIYLFFILLFLTGCQSSLVAPKDQAPDIKRALVGRWAAPNNTSDPTKTFVVEFTRDGSYMEMFGNELDGSGSYQWEDENQIRLIDSQTGGQAVYKVDVAGDTLKLFLPSTNQEAANLSRLP